MVQSHIPDNIRAELARQRKTQADIADCLGITRQAVSRRLLGYVVFDIDELAQVAALLDVSVADLINDRRTAS